jgi:hypothetical protein
VFLALPHCGNQYSKQKYAKPLPKFWGKTALFFQKKSKTCSILLKKICTGFLVKPKSLRLHG